MSESTVMGHRCGEGARDGAVQFAALDDSGEVVDLSAWKGEYVRIRWLPADPSAPGALNYGFFATEDDAGGGFAATEGGAIVATAPDFLVGGFEDVIVPLTHPFLLVASDTGTAGRLAIRNSDLGRSDGG